MATNRLHIGIVRTGEMIARHWFEVVLFMMPAALASLLVWVVYFRINTMTVPGDDAGVLMSTVLILKLIAPLAIVKTAWTYWRLYWPQEEDSSCSTDVGPEWFD